MNGMFGPSCCSRRFRFPRRLIARALLGVIPVFFGQAPSYAGPIYVFRETDGSIKFTDRKPPVGVKARIFEGSKPHFSRYHFTRPLVSSRATFKKAQRYGPFIEKLSREFSVDANLVKAVVHAESGFNHLAVSPKGARGLMQLMPDTARLVGVRNVFVAEDNLKGGVRYLAMLVNKYSNIQHALAAYNAGPGAVDQYGGVPPYAETKSYISRVLALRDRYRQGADKG